MFSRWLEPVLHRKLRWPHVHILFGARQTGKSTLLKRLLPDTSIWLDFSRPAERAAYLRDPDQLVGQCRALPSSRQAHVVVVDEAQNVPRIFDAVQHLYDSDQKRWRFVLCGSSARKLPTTGANLLPGRAVVHRLYPLTVPERPFPESAALPHAVDSPIPFAPREPMSTSSFAPTDLMERLTFGELPVVAVTEAEARADVLRSYSLVYLEEELRREALIKDWSAFVRFLRLAATESGVMINYTKVAKDAGVSVPTVKNYYQLLEDMFIGFRVTAFSGSPRKSILSTERFFFFDVGVRHAAAELPVEPATVLANPGPVFEQWVGTELWKRLQYLGTGSLHYMRTKGGAEVDFVVERRGQLTPVEVKWTEHPSPTDARHLLAFLAEHPKRAARGFVVCRCTRPTRIHEKVTAIPWFCL
ncbi:MAG: ATP-binding protein [Acidobacteriota bacterium]